MKNSDSFKSQYGIAAVADNIALAIYLRTVGEVVPNIDNPEADVLGNGYSFKSGEPGNIQDGYFTEDTKNQHLFGFDECNDDGFCLFRFEQVIGVNGKIVLLRDTDGKPVFAKKVGDNWVRPDGSPQDAYAPFGVFDPKEGVVWRTTKEWEAQVANDLIRRSLPAWCMNTIEIVNRKQFLSLNTNSSLGGKYFTYPIRTLLNGKNYYFRWNEGHGITFKNFDSTDFQHQWMNQDKFYEQASEIEDVQDDPDFSWVGLKKNDKEKTIKYVTPKGVEATVFRSGMCPEILQAVIDNNKNNKVDCSVLVDALESDVSNRRLGKILWEWALTSGVELWFTEGGFKTLALLAQGIVAIGLAGIWMGCKKDSDELRDGLAEQLGIATNNIVICFDQDPTEKVETRKHVSAAQKKLNLAIRNHLKNNAKLNIRHAVWKHQMGKGIDDVIANGNFDKVRFVGTSVMCDFSIAEIIDVEYLDASVFDGSEGKITVLGSPMNTAKTTSMKSRIEKLRSEKENVKVVSIGHRVALAGQQANSFGIKMMGEHDYNIDEAAMCVDSVHKLSVGRSALDIDLSTYRVTVIDESTSVFFHQYLGGTMTSDRFEKIRHECRAVIESLLSGEVHLMDADQNDLSFGVFKENCLVELVNMIHECEAAIARFDDKMAHAKNVLGLLQELHDNFDNRTRKLLNLATQKTKSKVSLIHDKSPLVTLDKFVADVAKGLRVIVLSSASNRNAKFAPSKLMRKGMKLQPHKKHLLINRINLDDPNHVLYKALERGTLNSIIAQYDYVYIDASVDCGIDINIPGHFYSCYTFCFQGEVNSMLQQLGRVRGETVIERHVSLPNNVAHDSDGWLPQDFDQYELIAKKELQRFKKQIGIDSFAVSVLDSIALLKAQSNITKKFIVGSFEYLAARQFDIVDETMEVLADIELDKTKKKALGKLSVEFDFIKKEDIDEHNFGVHEAEDLEGDDLELRVKKDGLIPEVRDILEKTKVREIYGSAGLRHVTAHTREDHKKIATLAKAMMPEEVANAIAQKDLEEIGDKNYNWHDVVAVSKTAEVELLRFPELMQLWCAGIDGLDMSVDNQIILEAFYELKKRYKPLNALPKGKFRFLDEWFQHGEEKVIVALNHLFGRSKLKLEPSCRPGKQGGKNLVKYKLCVNEGKQEVIDKKGNKVLKVCYKPLSQAAVLDAVKVMNVNAACLARATGLNEAERLLQEQISKMKGLAIA